MCRLNSSRDTDARIYIYFIIIIFIFSFFVGVCTFIRGECWCWASDREKKMRENRYAVKLFVAASLVITRKERFVRLRGDGACAHVKSYMILCCDDK